MKLGLSGNKDVDREILLRLPDKDLITVCGLNKYFYYTLCDDNFFYNKLVRSYPDILKYWDKGYETYTQFYLTMIRRYIFQLKKEFNYSYVKGNPQVQYRLFYHHKKVKNLLIASILAGEIELVKESIKRGGNIDYYALHLATHKGNLEMLKYLVENGEYVDDFSLLRQAIEYGYLEIVKYLIELLKNSQTVGKTFFHNLRLNQYNDTSLIHANLKGHEEVVNYFIQRGAHIDEDILSDYTGV